MGKFRSAKVGQLCPRYETPKVKYKSRAVAEFDAACMRKRGVAVESFKCPCGFWHVGGDVSPPQASPDSDEP